MNHPIFRFGRDSDVGEIFAAPGEAVLTTAEFNAWADFKNTDGSSFRNISPGERAALRARSDAIIAANRIPGTQTLRADFFSVPVPQDFATAMAWGVVGNVASVPAGQRGFATMNANEFDVTTEQGLKLYRLRQAYTADRWGFLGTRSPYAPRFIQFGVKLYF